MTFTRRHTLGLVGSGLLAASVPPSVLAQASARSQVVDMVMAACRALDAYGFPRALGQSEPAIWTRPEDGLYVFILDKAGALQLHPDRKVEGRSVIDTVDPTGKPFIREIIAAADAAPDTGVWTSYVWRSPVSGALGTKHTFSRMSGALIVSAGYFAEAA